MCHEAPHGRWWAGWEDLNELGGDFALDLDFTSVLE